MAMLRAIEDWVKQQILGNQDPDAADDNHFVYKHEYMKNEGILKVITIHPKKAVNLCTKRRAHNKSRNVNRKNQGNTNVQVLSISRPKSVHNSETVF